MTITNVLIFMILVAICFFGFSPKKTSFHADNKHEEAKKIRRQHARTGDFQLWKENGIEVYHHIVDMQDGTFGDWIVFVTKKGEVIEKSVFLPKDGILEEIEKWLNNKSATRIS